MGISIREMDELTLSEYHIVSAAYREKHKQKYEDSVNLVIIGAYHTEILRRQDRSKPLPKLHEFLIGGKPKIVKEQTPVDMLEVAKLWNAAFGGVLLVGGVPVNP